MNKEENNISSAIIELKAELLRKQEEFKLKKLNNETFVHKSKQSKKISSKLDRQNPNVLKRAICDEEDTPGVDIEDDLQKSRNALEEKAKIYDEIAQSSQVPDEDGSRYYLVDFQKKALDSLFEARNLEKKKTLTKTLSSEELNKEQKSSLSATDIYREKLIEKWDDEKKQLEVKSQHDIHYSNVQFDEIRNHGVGFFQFSKDHKEREAELADLSTLHKETLEEQSRKDKLKSKRKTLIEERLAKVRQRRKLTVPTNPEKEKNDSKLEVNDEKITPVPEVTVNVTESSVIDVCPNISGDKESHKKPMREWDKGKETVFPNHSYVEDRRKERVTDFAPPSSYFVSEDKTIKLQRKQLHTKRNKPQEVHSTQSSNPVTVNPVPHCWEVPEQSNKVDELNSSNYPPANELNSSFNYHPTYNQTFRNHHYPTQSPALQYSQPQYSEWCNAQPQPTIASEWCNAQPQPAIASEWCNAQPQPAIASEWCNAQPQPAIASEWCNAQPQPTIASEWCNAQPQPAIASEWCNAQPQPAIASEWCNAQPQPAIASEWCNAQSQPMVASDNFMSIVEPQPKKTKLSLVDTRFIKNNDLPTPNVNTCNVTAVPYTPGSFTAAKQSRQNEIKPTQGQISCAPLMYNTLKEETK